MNELASYTDKLIPIDLLQGVKEKERHFSLWFVAGALQLFEIVREGKIGVEISGLSLFVHSVIASSLTGILLSCKM